MGGVIDTSPNYGKAETVIGNLLQDIGIRDAMFMATKVDREDQQQGFERMNRSFELLGGDQIDLMQVHNLRGTEVELETMKEWKEQGRFRYLGVTTHRSKQYEEMEDVMRRHPLDFIQVNYSLADRGAEQRILPLARDRGYRSSGKSSLCPWPNYSRPLQTNPCLTGLLTWMPKSWAQVFLKFVVSHPASTLPIPGTTKPHHATDNMGAAVGRLPDERLRQENCGLHNTPDLVAGITVRSQKYRGPRDGSLTKLVCANGGATSGILIEIENVCFLHSGHSL